MTRSDGTTRTGPRLVPEGVFALLAAALCTAVLLVLSTTGYRAKPHIVAPALTIDLVVGLPVLGYLLLVRAGGRSKWILLPLVGLGLTLARWWIPTADLNGTPSLGVLIPAAEAGLLSFLLLRSWRVRAQYRSYRRGDRRPMSAARQALVDVLGVRMGGLLFSEAAVLWYAVTGWGRQPADSAGRSFSLHRRGGYPALLGALVMLIVVESFALHLLLWLWSPVAAWGMTFLSGYSLLWLLGDYHAARLNPITVDRERLDVTVGVRWHAVVARPQIRGTTDTPPSEPAVRLTLSGRPDFWLVLDEPVSVRGPFGIERRARYLGMGADDAIELRAALDSLPSRGIEGSTV